MTQLERYAQMMKVSLGKVEARVAYHVSAEGSVLAQTVQARADRIEIHYHIESADGCYVRQTVNRPGLFHDTITLNDRPSDLDDYPPPART